MPTGRQRRKLPTLLNFLSFFATSQLKVTSHYCINLQNHQCFSDGRLKNISSGIDIHLQGWQTSSRQCTGIGEFFIEAPFSSSFSPARDDAGTSEKLEQIGAFCFSGLPTSQTKEMRHARAAVEKTGALTYKPARRLCWGTTGTPENVDLAPRLSGSVPVEI